MSRLDPRAALLGGLVVLAVVGGLGLVGGAAATRGTVTGGNQTVAVNSTVSNVSVQVWNVSINSSQYPANATMTGVPANTSIANGTTLGTHTFASNTSHAQWAPAVNGSNWARVNVKITQNINGSVNRTAVTALYSVSGGGGAAPTSSSTSFLSGTLGGIPTIDTAGGALVLAVLIVVGLAWAGGDA